MVVVAAAADVPGHRVPHLVGAGVRIAVEQRAGAHQLAGGAEAALRAVMLDEGFLQRIELAMLREPLDGLDTPSVSPHGELATRVHILTVEQHGARTALTAIAADFGAGEAKVV